ncbi:MAG: DNA primase [Lactobacillus sp.]|nr:DNA primase [Lactobacillus sp.]
MSKFKDYHAIPEELKKLKQWGLFHLKWVEERKKNTKIPIDPNTGGAGKSNDPNTWSDFETALKALEEIDRADGLAFYFANGYVGLDIDHIKDDIADWHQGDNSNDNLVIKFKELTNNTYMEISQSGEGIHAIFKGNIPGKRRRKGNYEMYQKGRFFALTGNSISPPVVNSLNEREIQNLYNYLFGADKKIPTEINESNIESIDLSIPEIINRAENSKIGKRFELFMKGGWEQFYNSQSEADMAFANDLAFWCGRDFHKMDKIFKNSSLMREKYDEKRGATTYGTSLLNKAINETVNIYDPKQDGKTPDIIFNWNKPQEKTPARSWDDTGRGQRLNDQFGDVFRYMATDKKWYFYNGSFWEPDVGGRHIELAAEKVVNSLKTETPDLSFSTKTDQDKIQNEWRKFIKDSRSHMSKVHMIAEFKKYATIEHGVFDHDNMILNTESGYVDLTNGQLKDHDIKMMFSEQTQAEYSDNVDCPMWISFLNQIFDHDQELIHYIQKAAGYSATGSTAEQVMFLLLGIGRNGKSVFINVIRDVLGSYAKQMNVESIIVHNSGSGANSDIARLENTRLVTSSEANEGSRLDESLVKQMTGGDTLVARYQFGSEFEYSPKFKIWMATNHLPFIRGTDEGIWRRIKVIPFNVQIPKDKVDKNLESKLHSEWTGILNWIVQGAIMWQREGLEDPLKVSEASRNYRKSMDPLESFLDECCEAGGDYSVKARSLYDTYHDWAKRSNEHLMSMTKFGKELSKKLPRKRQKDGVYYYGIKLKKEPISFDWN